MRKKKHRTDYQPKKWIRSSHSEAKTCYIQNYSTPEAKCIKRSRSPLWPIRSSNINGNRRCGRGFESLDRYFYVIIVISSLREGASACEYKKNDTNRRARGNKGREGWTWHKRWKLEGSTRVRAHCCTDSMTPPLPRKFLRDAQPM